MCFSCESFAQVNDLHVDNLHMWIIYNAKKRKKERPLKQKQKGIKQSNA